MKPQLGYRKRALVSKAGGAEALQEELIAAIHGAFEVAVEIAVQEVRKLVGQATGDVYEEMRQENESLKLRLQRAEDMLESARLDERGGSSPHTKQHLDATTYTDPPLLPQCNQNRQDPMVGDVHDFTGGQGEPRPVDYPPDPQHGCMSRNPEQTPGSGVETKHLSDAASHPEKMSGLGFAYDALTTKVNEELSHVCVMKVETLNQTYDDYDSRPLPTHIDRTTLEQITVKQETREEERNCSASCLDLVKDDHFGSECMLQVQSKLLAEWKPEVLDIQSQDSNSPLPFTRLAKGHPPNLTTNLPPLTDLPSLSSEIPNIPEAPHKICGGNLRTSLNISHPHACKYCGQTFQLPSLLRRHYSQCPQKCYQQPVSKSRRTKVQLYPPGCSPFRCTVCSREFNRMENLKTHLRIHTGERPYTCSVCSTCFRHSGALTRHFRIHTGEKPYICGVCGKSFRNCGGLKFHQRSHNKQLQ